MRKPTETAADPFAPEAREAAVESTSTATADEATKRRGWRRLVQVNLLMVLVALALVSGYFAMRRNFLVPYLEQKEAREELARRGAQFSAVPANPKWVQTLFQISDDDFQDVEMIKLEHSDGIRDADLVHLHKFPHLKRLYLAATRITDDGLKHLRYCTKLRRISLWDTHVGDAGIRELETLTDLRIIDVHRTWTTDAALETLGRLPALEELVLDDATTKRGIAHLAGLKNLRRLSLRSTSLEADCLVLLADCPLEVLELPSANFADRKSADNFRHVPRLRSLALSLPGATDEDLEWLGQMKNLRTLHLSDLEAHGAFAGHVAKMRSLETLTIDSDRLQSEHLAELLSPPRLKEASLAIAITHEELARLPRRPIALTIRSPWYPTAIEFVLQEGKRVYRDAHLLAQTQQWIDFLKGGSKVYVNHSRRYMTEEDLAPLLAQKGLVELDLQNWEFAPGAFAALAQLEGLESVSLRSCRFEPDELKAIAELPKLRRFDADRSPVRDEQLTAFVASPRLESLTVHLTDAQPETVLALVKKESLNRLIVASTALDDAFLEAADELLAPRARAAVARIAVDGAPRESLPYYSFVSTAFSDERVRKFRERYAIAIGVAKNPGIEVPKEYDGAWPRGGSFGWIDPTRPAALELSPLKIDLPQIAEPSGGDAGQGEGARRYFAAYAEFASAHVWSLQVFGAQLAQGSSPYRSPTPPPMLDWQIAPAPRSHRQEPVQIPLDRFGAEATRRMLKIESPYLSLSEGSVPKECLEELAESKARQAVLGAGFLYDEATLQAIAGMPLLESVHFGTCRKPTSEEISLLSESPTLRTIMFEHRGEPMYFDEIATPGSRLSSISLTGKVVYDAEDAVRERPQSVILANFDERLWPAILEDPQSITNVRLHDDWPNQHRLRLRLEVLQREREPKSRPDEAATP